MKFEIESGIELPEEKAVSLEEFYNSMENQKYRRHYERLITRAQNRILREYSEKHHIIPKCLGGDNSCSNLAKLTAEEHYVAHQLLVKIYPKNNKLIYGANLMTISGACDRSGNKQYGWLKRKEAKISSERRKQAVVTQEIKDRISKTLKDKYKSGELVVSEISLKNLNVIKLGQKLSSEHSANISKGRTGIKLPEESCLSLKEAARKRIVSEETRAKHRKNVADGIYFNKRKNNS